MATPRMGLMQGYIQDSGNGTSSSESGTWSWAVSVLVPMFEGNRLHFSPDIYCVSIGPRITVSRDKVDIHSRFCYKANTAYAVISNKAGHGRPKSTRQNPP